MEKEEKLLSKDKLKVLLEYIRFEERDYLADMIDNLIELKDCDLAYCNSDNKLFREALYYHLYHSSNSMIDNLFYDDNIKKDIYNSMFEGDKISVSYTNGTKSIPLFNLTRPIRYNVEERPIVVDLYDTVLNISARKKLLNKLRDEKCLPELYMYHMANIKELVERSDELPIELVKARDYQKKIADKFLDSYKVDEKELISPYWIRRDEISGTREYYQTRMGACEEYTARYEENVVYEYQNDDRGITLVRKYPNNHPNVIVKKNIKYY